VTPETATFDTLPHNALPVANPRLSYAIILRDHLTPQRSNGFRSMVDRIRRDANTAMATVN